MSPARISSTFASAAAAAGALALVLTASGVGAAGAISPVPPTVRVQPNNVMVNTDTHVIGRGFAAGSSVTLVECAKTSWIAPQNPCDTDNAVTVTTNGHGAFKTLMKVEACPSGATSPPGLAETCYIGVQKLGVDNGTLSPFARIVVTFP